MEILFKFNMKLTKAGICGTRMEKNANKIKNNQFSD